MKRNKNEIVPAEPRMPSVPEELEPAEEETLPIRHTARNISLIMILIALLVAAFVALLGKNIFASGIASFKTAYQEAFDSARADAASDNPYIYLRMEDIQVGELHEMANLVVLTVSDTEVNVINTDDNRYNIASWVKMDGYADYTVDMTKAEFIVDSARGSVTVRIPEPELGPVTANYDEKEQLFTENKWFNNSDAAGAEIAQQQSNDLKDQIEEALTNNTRNDEFARDAAPDVVKNLVLELNPTLNSANVIVEYFS